MAWDRNHACQEWCFSSVHPARMEGKRNREPLIADIGAPQRRFDFRKFLASPGYNEMRGEVDCRQFSATAEELLRKQRRICQYSGHPSRLAIFLKSTRLSHYRGQCILDA